MPEIAMISVVVVVVVVVILALQYGRREIVG
jgi:hypothetical protein